MNAIYEPKGAAHEYAELACNVYRGCSHQCRYCYVPGCLHWTREEWAKVVPAPRAGIVEAVRREVGPGGKYEGDKREILLSFTSDPYQVAELKYRATWAVLEELVSAGCRTSILTKNPQLAARDHDLMLLGDTNFGVTFVFMQLEDCTKWETDAPCYDRRRAGLIEAKDAGLRTWVSLEPVIYPAQTLAIIEDVHRWVDVFKIGKLNHDAEREAGIDWGKFLKDAVATCERFGAKYTIKAALKKAAQAERG